MKALSLIAAAAVLATGCTTIQHPATEQAYITAAAADTGTTAVALSTGRFVESNPAGFAAVTALKGGIYLFAKNASPADQQFIYKAGSTAFGAAAVHNLFALAGAANPVCWLAFAAYGAYEATR